MPSTYGERRAYADIAGSFRRGAGRTYASQGDFDRATRIDPDNVETYAGLERRDREATQRSGQEALTRAVATNDYRGAENVAAKMGDPAALASVRTMRTQFDANQRTEAYRRGQRLVSDLEGIQALPAEQQAAAYATIRNRSIEEARADGADPASVDAILPPTFSPMAVGAARGRADAMMRAIMDPEDIAAMERDQRRLDIQDRQADISDRRADAAEMTALAAMRRADQAGGSSGAHPMTPEEAAQWGISPDEMRDYAVPNNGGAPVPLRTPRTQYTDAAMSSAGYASRMSAADRTLREIEATYANRPGFWAQVMSTAALNGGTPDMRRYRQAIREFQNSILRRESGAVINPSEFQSAYQQYAVIPGAGAQELQQRQAARQRSINHLVVQSQGAYEDNFDTEGNPVVRAPPAGGSATEFVRDATTGRLVPRR